MSRLCLRASCRRFSSCLCAAARAVWPGPCLDLQTNLVDYSDAALLARCILVSPSCTPTKLQHLHVIRPVSQKTPVKACQEHRVMQSCECIYYASRAVDLVLQCSLVEQNLKLLTLSLLC